MSARAMAGVALALIALAACGCVDPSVYESPAERVSGLPTAPPSQPRVYPPPTYIPPTLPPPVSPPVLPTVPQPGDIRVPAPQPTDPVVASGNVTITVDKIGTSATTADDATLAFRYADENVVVQSPGTKLARRNGIRVGVAAGNWRVQFGADARRARHSSYESVFITVMSGAEGQIAMGSEVYVPRLIYWTPLGHQVLLEQDFVGRTLVTRPRILGDGLVEVELWPRFTTRRGRRVIDVTELATKVVVRNGQSIVLGGTSGATDDVAAVLFGIGTRTSSHNMTVVLTPTIGGATIDWPRGRW